MDLSQRVGQLTEYELVDTPDAFVAAITALATRTEREGHPGVLLYQFYVNAAGGTAGAMIVYENAEAWAAHHELAYQWPEMPALQATVELQRLVLFGPLNDEIDSFLANANLPLVHYDAFAAGFDRS